MKPLIQGATALCFMVSLPLHADVKPCEGADGVFRVNPDKSPGGFVAASARVGESVIVGREAQICENAILEGPVKVVDSAIILGRAKLQGKIAISGDAQVDGEARLVNDEVSEDLLVMDDARIYGRAYLEGNIIVSGKSEIYGRAQIYDFVQIHGDSRVCANSILSRNLVLFDDITYCPAKLD